MLENQTSLRQPSWNVMHPKLLNCKKIERMAFLLLIGCLMVFDVPKQHWTAKGAVVDGCGIILIAWASLSPM